MFDNIEQLRQGRKSAGRKIQGRLPGNEEDLLRAAILFSGAGMDAALKRLIEDALPSIVEISTAAHNKLEVFLVARIKGEFAPSRLAKYILSPSPRSAAIDDYIWTLTGESLQSVEQVDKVAAALGLNDSELRQDIRGLKPLFHARNQISHELDLQQTQRQGDKSRVARRMADTAQLAHSGLNVAQKMLNGVAACLSASV